MGVRGFALEVRESSLVDVSHTGAGHVFFFCLPVCMRTYVPPCDFCSDVLCSYYMDNLKRFCEPDFASKILEEDIVMARIRTTGRFSLACRAMCSANTIQALSP